MALDDHAWLLRRTIYAGLADTGSVPTRDVLAATVDGTDELDRTLRALHDHHQLVLDADGSIRMALPFSATPTDHVVRAGDRQWYANCAWDSLAIPAALDIDSEIEAPWLDDGSPVDLRVADGELVGDTDAQVHFVVPAHRWWHDIVET